MTLGVFVCPVLAVQLDVLRGPERLPADEQSQEVLRGKLHLLQSDSTELEAVLTVPPTTQLHNIHTLLKPQLQLR